MDPIVIIAIILGIILIIGFIILFVLKSKKNKFSQHNEKISLIISNLGGYDNINNVNVKMSRIEFSLKNYDIVNKDELKNLGVQGISKTSQKITLVVGNELAADINRELTKEAKN